MVKQERQEVTNGADPEENRIPGGHVMEAPEMV
jgi:hypothetical protein